MMIRNSSILLLCFLCFSAYSQNKKIDFPYKGDKIVYHFEQEIRKKKVSKTLEKLMGSLKTMEQLKVTRADEEKGLILLKGQMKVHTVNRLNPVEFEGEIFIEKEKVIYEFHHFYFTEIGESLENLIRKNEASEEEKVQKNLWFMTSHLDQQVKELAKAFSATLTGASENP